MGYIINNCLKYFGGIIIKFSKYFSRENLYRLLDDAIDRYVPNRENVKIVSIGAGGK